MSRRVLALALALLLAACGGEPQPLDAQPPRQGRFGSLRDFVLFERPLADGGSFFLDRFEVTRGDWAAFAGSDAGESEDRALPQLGVDLQQARAFAHWRFARLPRFDEWQFAATCGGYDLFPWGSVWRSACANCFDLQLVEPTPVGTFESGRKGDGPYDLIGNAAEWTETVPPAFLRGLVDDSGSQLIDADVLLWRLRQAPGLEVWLRPWMPVPLPWLCGAADARVPRLCVGGDFLTPMGQKPAREQLQVPRLPGDRDPALGLRLCCDPESLLRALSAHRQPLLATERALVLGFLARGQHRQVLAPAFAALWPEASGTPAGGEVMALLAAELGR